MAYENNTTRQIKPENIREDFHGYFRKTYPRWQCNRCGAWLRGADNPPTRNETETGECACLACQTRDAMAKAEENGHELEHDPNVRGRFKGRKLSPEDVEAMGGKDTEEEYVAEVRRRAEVVRIRGCDDGPFPWQTHAEYIRAKRAGEADRIKQPRKRAKKRRPEK